MSIIGNRVYTWEVVEKDTNDKKYNYDYKCKCNECGNEEIFNKHNFLAGKVSKCNVCEKKKVIEMNYEEFSNMFNEELNEENLPIPEEIVYNKEYTLICEKGHKFRTSIEKFSGCTKCKMSNSRKSRDIAKAEMGDNFENAYSHRVDFWDYEKNELNPSQVLPKSKQPIHFICEKGHEFSVSPANIYKGTWCPVCDSNNTESKLATYVKEMCKAMFEEVLTEQEFPINTIVAGEETTLYPDVIIKDLKLNIEIHGSQHFKFVKHIHKDRNGFTMQLLRDKAKKEELEKRGYIQWIIPVTSNLNKDIETFENAIIRLLSVSRK